MASGYLLDTNIISETRKARADGGVMAFLSAADATALFLSVLPLRAISKGGAAKRGPDPVPAGRLGVWVDGIETTFVDRILSIDAPVARLWGEQSADRGLPVIDALIVATALV